MLTLKICLTPKDHFERKIILTQILFLTQKFFEPKIFLTQHFSIKILMKFDTEDLSIVF